MDINTGGDCCIIRHRNIGGIVNVHCTPELPRPCIAKKRCHKQDAKLLESVRIPGISSNMFEIRNYHIITIQQRESNCAAIPSIGTDA
jgi:hypothetical protein